MSTAVCALAGQVPGATSRTQITHTSFDYFGRRLATANTSGTVNVYDVSRSYDSYASSGVHADVSPPLLNSQIPAGPGAPRTVWSLDWANPAHGQLLACGLSSGEIQVWSETKPSNWQCQYTSREHVSSLLVVKFLDSATQLELAAASADGYVSVHSFSKGTWRRSDFCAHVFGVTSLTWVPSDPSIDSPIARASQTPDLSALMTPTSFRLITGGQDFQIRMWNCSSDASGNSTWSKETDFPVQVHHNWVSALACQPAADEITTGGRRGSGASSYNTSSPIPLIISNFVASAARDGSIAVWSLNSDGLSWKLAQKMWVSGECEEISWSVTGEKFVVAYSDILFAVFQSRHTVSEELAKNRIEPFIFTHVLDTSAVPEPVPIAPPPANRSQPSASSFQQNMQPPQNNFNNYQQQPPQQFPQQQHYPPQQPPQYPPQPPQYQQQPPQYPPQPTQMSQYPQQLQQYPPQPTQTSQYPQQPQQLPPMRNMGQVAPPSYAPPSGPPRPNYGAPPLPNQQVNASPNLHPNSHSASPPMIPPPHNTPNFPQQQYQPNYPPPKFQNDYPPPPRNR